MEGVNIGAPGERSGNGRSKALEWVGGESKPSKDGQVVSVGRGPVHVGS